MAAAASHLLFYPLSNLAGNPQHRRHLRLPSIFIPTVKITTRPNFGLNELNFVFSALVVRSILNFTLMYLLTPTPAASTASATASSLPSYIFEHGSYALSSRITTLINKDATFAFVGFAAGLVETAIMNGLITLRKSMDLEFVSPNKPPPTLLNAMTWAGHMGINRNLRYQTLNGLEFVLRNVLPPAGFKVSIVGLRCLNNVLGWMLFVLLAWMTKFQKVEEKKAKVEESLIVENAMTDSGVEERSSNCGLFSELGFSLEMKIWTSQSGTLRLC